MDNIGALRIRIGFGGRLYYYSDNKEPPHLVLVIILAPYTRDSCSSPAVRQAN